MTALSALASVYVLPNVADSEEKIHIAQKNLTFRHLIKDNIITLSTGNVRRGDDISGLLYTPQMDEEDECYYGYVQKNTTRLQDLPPLRFDIVGVAPWITRNCTYRYLNSAHDDNGNTKAFILFYPNNTSEAALIPPEENPDYALDYSKYSFPVYKIGTADGVFLTNQMGKYSGNMTDVWDQPDLAKKYNITNMARVYIDIDTGARNTLPGVWLFLSVVFGVLLFILGCTSLIMHLTQYRYRLALQRRVASGEVDLEAMGIKRLTVPKEILKRFPLRTYEHNITPPSTPRLSSSEPTGMSFTTSDSNSSVSTAAVKENGSRNTSSDEHSDPAMLNGLSHAERRGIRNHAYCQTNCAVCLEDYEPGVTRVRELPCLHIFHPECIDPHLSSNSSLCPICKASVLPKGFVPAHLTNATVRRERQMRRMRERYINQMETTNAPPVTGIQSVLQRLVRVLNQRFLDTPMSDSERPGLGTTAGASNSVRDRSHGPLDLPRSMSFSATPAPTQQEEEEEWRNLSIWSRVIKRVFPR